jgi:hypothetical protein
MKTKIILTMLSFAVLLACNNKNNRSFVPGIYINNTSGSYSIADDTLNIQASDGNRFTIERKTGFNLIRDGKKGKREHEAESWNAILDEKIGVLTETKHGKSLIFYPDSNMLMIGKRVYKKLN